jgi:hypothetical protein
MNPWPALTVAPTAHGVPWIPPEKIEPRPIKERANRRCRIAASKLIEVVLFQNLEPPTERLGSTR